MDDNILLGMAVVAIFLSIVAIATSVMTNSETETTIGPLDTEDLAAESVTSTIIANDTITDADICNDGISTIADQAISEDQIEANTIAMFHLTAEIQNALSNDSISTMDIGDGSITGTKIMNQTITSVDISDDSITSEKIEEGEIKNGDIADNAITSDKIEDNTVSSDDIKNHVRYISFPANALNYEENDQFGVIKDHSNGLLWRSTWMKSAEIVLRRPGDWEGTSNLTFCLYFRANHSVDGEVQFFIRPTSIDIGENGITASAFRSDPVQITEPNKVYKQVFEIPASKFGSKELWSIRIQRAGINATYDDDVILRCVSLSYNAIY